MCCSECELKNPIEKQKHLIVQLFKIEQCSAFQPFPSPGTSRTFMIIWRNLSITNSTLYIFFRELSKEYLRGIWGEKHWCNGFIDTLTFF